jgi:hypothetical protein
MALTKSEAAAIFLKYDYAETKDLAKHFLTFISAILVFSLTFTEKIINTNPRKRNQRWSVIICWLCFFVSIVMCGLAICFISLAGARAAYARDYGAYANLAWIFMICAGVVFVLGLMALMTAGILSVFREGINPRDEPKIAPAAGPRVEADSLAETRAASGDLR